MFEYNIRPFLQWVGGKRNILHILRENYPIELNSTIDTYIEPCVGAGTVFLDIVQNFKIKRLVINDYNTVLINVYEVIKYEVDALINKLAVLKDVYSTMTDKERYDFYYSLRHEFNICLDHMDGNEVDVASKFIFLNKTCFNGVYRVNKKGKFNVPVGDRVDTEIYDAENLKSWSKILKNVTILSGDYMNCSNYITPNTFLYMDPPYRKVNKGSFTNYTIETIKDIFHTKMAQFLTNEVHLVGAKFLLSNANPKVVNIEDNFFDMLYKDFTIIPFMSKYNLGNKANIGELLIRNYDYCLGN